MDCSPPGSSVHGNSPGKTTVLGCHALPGDLPDSKIEPGSPALLVDSLPTDHRGSPKITILVFYCHHNEFLQFFFFTSNNIHLLSHGSLGPWCSGLSWELGPTGRPGLFPRSSGREATGWLIQDVGRAESHVTVGLSSPLPQPCLPASHQPRGPAQLPGATPRTGTKRTGRPSCQARLSDGPEGAC